MASVTRYRAGWRAHVYVQGTRESKLFRTRTEANAWGAQREKELAAGVSGLLFGDVAEAFLKLQIPTLTNAQNQRGYEQSIREHVLPVIGHRKLQDIRRTDLVTLVQGIAAKGTIETAHRVGQRICAILNHAVDLGAIESHPAADLARVLPRRVKRPMPAVSVAELPALLQAIATYDEPVTRIGLQILAHTFVRTSELTGARWDEIRDDVWLVPGDRMKRRIPHVVPLSPHVRALLAELEPMTGESEYWLASRINPRASISENTMLFALYRLGYRGRMTGHGFRSIASTVLNESGKWHKDAIERQLAHKESDDVRGVYHRAEYFEERKRLMAWYSAYLEERAAITAS
jgi:integrase